MAVALKRCGQKRYGLFYKSIITENVPDINGKWTGNGRERGEELEKKREREEEEEKRERERRVELEKRERERRMEMEKRERERRTELEKKERERGEELEKREKKIEKKSGEICICENFVVNLQPIANWGGLSNKGVV